jgi:hypothetical protein
MPDYVCYNKGDMKMTKPQDVLYLLIDPAKKAVTSARFASLNDAELAAGLSPLAVDHGSLGPELGIVVYEYGLFEPKDEMSYFALGERLYAGNAVIYAEREGERVDVAIVPDIRWFDSADEVMKAIEMGDIVQPAMTVGGEVVWVWPQPKPTFFEREKE